MPIDITLPRQGWSMGEGTFLGWLKKEGDAVKAGDPLFSVESEKAAFDVDSTDAGILSIPTNALKPGDVVKVGCLLGYLLTEGEAAPGTAMPASPAPVAIPEASPRAETPPPASAIRPSPGVDRFAASPRARRAAKELRVDLSELQPTGQGGRIRERDVRAVSPPPATVASAAPAAPGREVPVTAQRRTIAERMMSSLKNTAPVTLTCRCDATNLVALRSEYKLAAGNPIVPSFTDIIAKLAAIALGSHPMLAGRWEGERILLPDAIHIGIAVDTGHGLLVPVVRNVSELSLLEVSRRSRDLIEAARSRRLKSDDMQGGCFTLSNLGGFGIEAFTPIINYPETAVLGLGAILRAPAVLEDGQLGIREQITLSLTFDHRVVDGAPAARFLQALRQGIEKPAGWLSRETEGIAHDHRK